MKLAISSNAGLPVSQWLNLILGILGDCHNGVKCLCVESSYFLVPFVSLTLPVLCCAVSHPHNLPLWDLCGNSVCFSSFIFYCWLQTFLGNPGKTKLYLNPWKSFIKNVLK